MTVNAERVDMTETNALCLDEMRKIDAAIERAKRMPLAQMLYYVVMNECPKAEVA